VDYYLGIDAGTSGLKVVAIDAHGAMRGTGSASYRLSTPRSGWAEADPHDWWTALCAATRQLLVAARIDAAQIVAVSFSGQMHTLVLLDAQCTPVRPAISWADTRGSDERREIEGRIGRTRLIEITGSPAVTAVTATKMLWVRRHEPEVWQRARVAMLCKDYVRWRLTGTVATDPTDAGATGLLDVRAGVGTTGARRLGHTACPPASDLSIDRRGRARFAHRGERDGCAPGRLSASGPAIKSAPRSAAA